MVLNILYNLWIHSLWLQKPDTIKWIPNKFAGHDIPSKCLMIDLTCQYILWPIAVTKIIEASAQSYNQVIQSDHNASGDYSYGH